MNKRIKSGLIVFGSIALSAFITIVPTVEFSNFIQWIRDIFIAWGWSPIVLSLLASFLSQVWMGYLNIRKDQKMVSRSRNGQRFGHNGPIDYY